jgi:hypothetical protein
VSQARCATCTEPGAGCRDEAIFTAFGLRFGLRAGSPSMLARLVARVPYGWQPGAADGVDLWYTLCPAGGAQRVQPDDHHRLYSGGRLTAHDIHLDAVLARFEDHAALAMAEHCREYLFVHAGAVGWRGRAIVLPGRTHAGKTTLVRALVQAGAVYYSDEFVLLDAKGRVHPYARPPVVRDAPGARGRPVGVASLGGRPGTAPLRIGLIVVTRYEAGARWRPRRLTPGQALLALLDSAVAARSDPALVVPALRRAADGAEALEGRRGEAAAVARALLRRASRAR